MLPTYSRPNTIEYLLNLTLHRTGCRILLVNLYGFVHVSVKPIVRIARNITKAYELAHGNSE